jgi:hypothetical protein
MPQGRKPYCLGTELLPWTMVMEMNLVNYINVDILLLDTC